VNILDVNFLKCSPGSAWQNWPVSCASRRLAKLTASIAHEINQPLGAILTNAETADEILKSPTPDIAELKEIVKDILQADRRASEVIRRMRSLLTKAPFELKSLDLDDVVRETFEFLSTLAVSYFLPSTILPLLMIGAAYLCYEGVETMFEAVLPHRAHQDEAQLGTVALNTRTAEDAKVASATRPTSYFRQRSWRSRWRRFLREAS
jgi:signal transduction histidine kinase